jgi:hypothetical protein
LPPRKKAAKKNLGTEEVMQDPNVKSESTKASSKVEPIKSDSEKTISPLTAETAASNYNTPKADSAASSTSKSSAAPSSKTQAPPIEATVPDPHSSGAASTTSSGTSYSSVSHEAQSEQHDLHARIQRRAYLNFLDRQQSSHHGDAHSDWARAEQQVREEQERGQGAPAPKSQPDNAHKGQGVRKDDAYKSAKA